MELGCYPLERHGCDAHLVAAITRIADSRGAIQYSSGSGGSDRRSAWPVAGRCFVGRVACFAYTACPREPWGGGQWLAETWIWRQYTENAILANGGQHGGRAGRDILNGVAAVRVAPGLPI